MKKSLLAGVAVSALMVAALPAGAADIARMPTKAPVVAPVALYNWTGFYIGGFVGGAFGDGRVAITDTGTITAVPGFPVGTPYNDGLGHSWGYRIGSSVIAGGTLGYNWQIGQIVVGVEGELGYIRRRGSAADPTSPALDTVAATRIGDWYGVIDGRLGWAWDRLLIYVKGGAAFVDSRTTVTDVCSTGGCGPGLIRASGDGSDWTWNLGGGLEWALANNWSIKGEYLYLDTKDTFSVCGTNTGVAAGAVSCWRASVPGTHTLKFGINYRFNLGGPVVASY